MNISLLRGIIAISAFSYHEQCHARAQLCSCLSKVHFQLIFSSKFTPARAEKKAYSSREKSLLEQSRSFSTLCSALFLASFGNLTISPKPKILLMWNQWHMKLDSQCVIFDIKLMPKGVQMREILFFEVATKITIIFQTKLQ